MRSARRGKSIRSRNSNAWAFEANAKQPATTSIGSIMRAFIENSPLRRKTLVLTEQLATDSREPRVAL